MRQKCGTKYSEWVDEVIKGCCITVIPEMVGALRSKGGQKRVVISYLRKLRVTKELKKLLL